MSGKAVVEDLGAMEMRGFGEGWDLGLDWEEDLDLGLDLILERLDLTLDLDLGLGLEEVVFEE